MMSSILNVNSENKFVNVNLEVLDSKFNKKHLRKIWPKVPGIISRTSLMSQCKLVLLQ